MVDIVKPDISSVWAEAGAVIAPSNEKIKLGWTSEVPPHQYENFVQNRQDEMLAYLNQKGVPEWRTGTEYFLGKSFVQDAGKIYKANKNSGGLLPSQKPSTDATNEYWEQATFSLSDLKQAVGTSTKDVMSQKATSDAIDLKVDSTRVKQVTGVSTTDIMSQKAVTDALAGVDKFNGSVVTIPSAATVDLTALAPNTSQIVISGTESITGFTVAAGRAFVAKFSGACTLANSAALVTGRGTNIQIAAGDSVIIRSTAANVVEILPIDLMTDAAVGTRGQTWQNLLGSRVTNTNYTNATGRPIEIVVAAATGNYDAYLMISGVRVGTFTGIGSGTLTSTVTAIVPVGAVYQMVTSGTPLAWSELR